MLTQRLHLPRTVMPLALLLAWPLAQAQTMTSALSAAPVQSTTAQAAPQTTISFFFSFFLFFFKQKTAYAIDM